MLFWSSARWETGAGRLSCCSRRREFALASEMRILECSELPELNKSRLPPRLEELPFESTHA